MTVWLLSSCVLIAVLLLLRRLLKHRLDPRVTYALWLLAAVRILVPVSLFDLPVSVSGLAERSGLTQAVEEVRYTTEHDTLVSAPDTTQTPEDFRQTIEDNDALRDSFDGGQAEIVSVERDDSSGALVANVELTRDRFVLLRQIWCAGAVLAAVWFLHVNLRFARQLRQRRTPCQGPLPLDCPLPVYVAEGLPSPCLFGLFHPAVYLNRAAADGGQLDHILTHELTHFRHRDHWWAAVRCLCLCVQWFNPLVWLAAVLSRQDCETACDAAAIARLGEGERLAYGRTLVDMIAAGQRRPHALFETATTMTGSPKRIFERVTLIAQKPKMTVLTLSAVLLAAAVAAGCAFGGADRTVSAQDYLDNAGDEELLAAFLPATYPTGGFDTPEEIDSNELFRFVVLADDSELYVRWYDEDSRKYVIPVSDLTQVLDRYFESYQFDPAEVIYGTYDESADTLTVMALGFGTGSTNYSFQSAEAVDDETVRVVLAEASSSGVTITAKITGDGVRFLSCHRNESEFALRYEALMAGSGTDEECQQFLDLVLNDRFAANQFAQLLDWENWETSGRALMERLTPYLASLRDTATVTDLMDIMDDYGKMSFSSAFAEVYLQAYGDQELSGFNEWVNTPGNNGFFCSLYVNPEQIDLDEAFYIGLGSDATRDTDPAPRYCLTAGEINEILQLRLGITYSEDWLITNFPWEYDDEEGAFYHTHGDTNFRFVFCYGMLEENGVFTAYCYVQELGLTTVRMERAEDGGYRIFSHMLTGENSTITPAQLAQSVYDDIVGTEDGRRDFYLEVDDGGEVTRLSITAENGYNVGRSGSDMLDQEWASSFVGQSPSGVSVTLESADGDSRIQCWEDSDLVLLHQNGADTWLTAVPQTGDVSLFESLRQIGEDIVWDQAFDVSAPSNDPQMDFDYPTGDGGAIVRYALQVAKNLREAPDWVTWKPEDAQMREVGITQSYFYGDLPNFCGYISLYIKRDDFNNIKWASGSGVDIEDSGEYAGWGIYTIGTSFYLSQEIGEYVCYDRYTGQGHLLLPSPVDEAPLDELLHDMLFTSGPDNWYLIPTAIFTRFTPEEVCQALVDFHPAGVDWQARQVTRSLGDFLRERGGQDGLPSYEEVYALMDSRLQPAMEEGHGERGEIRYTPENIGNWNI